MFFNLISRLHAGRSLFHYERARIAGDAATAFVARPAKVINRVFRWRWQLPGVTRQRDGIYRADGYLN